MIQANSLCSARTLGIWVSMMLYLEGRGTTAAAARGEAGHARLHPWGVSIDRPVRVFAPGVQFPLPMRPKAVIIGLIIARICSCRLTAFSRSLAPGVQSDRN